MPFDSGPVLMYVGAGRYRTVGVANYVGQRQVFRIPDGFETDLASVPRVFWAFLPPNGTYEKAAVLHDTFCAALARGDCEVSSRDADAIFRRVAREGGAGFLTRWALWTGVRLGALANPHRRPGIGPDLPLMLLITAAGAAVVVGVFATVHLLVDWAGRLI
jgi:hypothetical protein